MNIGIYDVDGGIFPNLALMKIAAHHKGRGDRVEWWNGLAYYDRVYMAKVFTDEYTQETPFIIQADEVIRGGTGYGKGPNLPDEIEHARPDYSIYGYKKALGFLTRGCPRACPFCIVSDKEGRRARQVAELGEFWTGQNKIVLLDPNITAAKECERLFNDLIKTGAEIEFNQGLDVRLLTDKGADQLNQMRLGILHFAWDNYEMATYEKLKQVRPLLKYNERRLRVYVLVNFNTTIAQDLERVYKLRELGFDPYVMVYDKPKAPPEVRRLQRWVNNKFVWRVVDRFEDYRPM